MIRFEYRKLLVPGALVLFLQACVSYHTPTYETIRSDAYYEGNAEYADAFDGDAPDVAISFSDAAYYPWWSMDYYYLGPHYYRPGYWPGPRFSLGYRYGFPPNYWSYYGFYSPFYYPYSTYAWYDPWYGWPRYGIGTNYFWQEAAWASRNSHWSPARQRQPVRSAAGNSRYENLDGYGSAFDDPRDRAPTQSTSRGSFTVAPGTNTGSMQVRQRSETKIRQSRTGSTATVSAPGSVRQPSKPDTRSTPSTPRPVKAPRPGSSSTVPDYQPGKKRKNQ